MYYGYCRCSTDETKQNIDRQKRELITMGVPDANIFFEYAHGTERNRRELNRLLGTVQAGDTIVATELSRITRSVKDLIEILEITKEKKLRLILGSFDVDCTKEELDPMTEGMLKMMGVFAELERNIISQRVKSGLSNAKEKGKTLGRPRLTKDDLPKKFLEYYPLYKNGSIRTKSALARIAEVDRKTVTAYIKVMEENNDGSK